MLRIAAWTSTLTLLAGLIVAVLSLPPGSPGLVEECLTRLPISGSRHPVTAVLLNFRGYDTLLELCVLLLSIAGVWSLRKGEWPRADLRDRPLLMSFLRFAIPLLVLAAAYLLWIGSFAPGGAFQGGALLGGAMVLAMLGNLGRRYMLHMRLLRMLTALGPLVFTIASAIAAARTGGILQYPADSAGNWILTIETAAFVSIALILGLLYYGGMPPERTEDISGEGDSDHD